MFRQMAQDHMVLYLMLMAILGLTLGFVGTLLIYIILSWEHVITAVYTMFSLGGM